MRCCGSGTKHRRSSSDPTNCSNFSCTAEAVGFDSVFISDHFQPWKHTGGHAPSSIAWLGALGARTRRVIIGTSVMTPTFRYHPSVVAQAFATLGVMFPNRVVLGLGSGESLNDVPAIGIKWPPFKERQARLRESIALMRALWSEERVTFEGQYYKTEKATIYDRPAKPVPIYVAASGPTSPRWPARSRRAIFAPAARRRSSTRRRCCQCGCRPASRRPCVRIDRSHDRDEGLVRHRSATGARRHQELGRIGAVAGGKVRSRMRSRSKSSPMRCRSSAPPSAGSFSTDPTSMSRRSRSMPISAFAISCSMPRGQTRNGFCTSMASRSCRVCAPPSAEP